MNYLRGLSLIPHHPNSCLISRSIILCLLPLLGWPRTQYMNIGRWAYKLSRVTKDTFKSIMQEAGLSKSWSLTSNPSPDTEALLINRSDLPNRTSLKDLLVLSIHLNSTSHLPSGTLSYIAWCHVMLCLEMLSPWMYLFANLCFDHQLDLTMTSRTLSLSPSCPGPVLFTQVGFPSSINYWAFSRPSAWQESMLYQCWSKRLNS